MMSDENHIDLRGISKSFGPVQALEDVSFSIKRNEVIGLVGDNGAGKSTLIKILSGVHQPTEGEMLIDGEVADFDDYDDAQDAGIETVYQELAISPQRSVAENVFLGKEPERSGPLGKYLGFVDDERMRRESREVLDRLGIDVDPTAEAGGLSGGQQQTVAVARALQSDPEIIILDEPTSALSVEASEKIMDLVDDLKAEGHTIIMISHSMEEIFEVTDRVAVLASGRLMDVKETTNTSQDELVQLMMGMEAPA